MSRRCLSLLGLIVLGAPFAIADGDDLAAEKYLTPPREVMDAVLAPWNKNVSITNISPDRKRYLVMERESLVPLNLMGKPYYNLGGLQVDYQANRSRNLTTRASQAFRICTIGEKKEVRIEPPTGAYLGGTSWSPDGSQVAYFVHFANGSRLYIADAATGKSRCVTGKPLMLTMDESFDWIDGGKRIVAVFVPDARAKEPNRPLVAETPRVRVTDAKTTSLKTFPALLDSPYDESLLEFYGSGQLAIVDVVKGAVQPIGKPAMITAVDPSPDGKYFLITAMEKPFSYIVPQSNFPERQVIWDATGAQKAEITKRGLRLGRPEETRPDDNAKRSLAWRIDGSGLGFLQTAPPAAKPATDPPEDDEQGRRGQRGSAAGPGQPNRKDRVMLWTAPFGPDDTKQIYESPTRIGSVRYSEDGQTLFITNTVDAKERISAIRLSEVAKAYVIVENTTGDNANDTSDLLSRPAKNGAGQVVRISADGKYVFLGGAHNGKDPTQEAPKPFIDRVEIATGAKTRVFESKDDVYETATALDDDLNQLVVTRQSPKMVPNAFLRTGAQETPLTDNCDYLPDLTQARRETIVVTRPDGFHFQVVITMPSGGSKMPALFWFYPSEFTDQAAYDRSKRAFNKNAFRGVSSSNKVILLREGYAVVEPDCPIVGPTGRMNDEYVPQLRNNLAATIDALEAKGWIDRQRLAIGGHSYGAFSTLNAMVNTPFFKAGIAGDGNYNRSLTPFGFQSEQRQLWDGREMYLAMSPMLYLEQITGAVLLYHGIDDQNLGTDPINSIKMFQALQALGKPAAMYMYPYEDHGQVGRETVLDQWARWVMWLDKYVKNPPKP